ncbi:pyruvate dehydrogenase complex dihydrolipoamide acetyltransferase [Methylovirgula ligni]|uniref:Acetyltransferase component of pyruvate dehydrogenase complex n=1 Tax=Methylovirgula ligni TaxID=569860 RepID=A0A3D9Z4C5_9HYPH|nr:pyruvate dehydrogenase complex dihydrolipoamide acetyltransferase [Methylovirgula ligni]QAY96770.1 pyruvate dehydrogenase complex dihydrolipoamide acetyltransferase [Methylovirgula ligni]REF88199.1 pyruvate dehydrogenase E2 component (dihydrolipoamide acetyltransferase) [Methylovirgula ligni]
MSVKILMPALSPTMEKGNLTRWLKAEGDAVKSGDVIAEIETDKATMEVEAVDEGTLGKILVPAGTNDVPVNEIIALIAEEGEDPKTLTAGSSAPVQPAAPVPLASVSTPTAPASAPGNVVAFPQAEAGKPARRFASPLARRLAGQNKLDLAAVTGSGPHGRIIAADVTAALAAGVGKAAPAAAAVAPLPKPTQSDAIIKQYFASDSFDEVPHETMRKTIARRLVEATTNIPHFYLTIECEIDALLKLRGELNAAAPKAKDGTPDYKLSVNDMIVKALALALIDVPNANVTFLENSMLRHHHADVAVAVAIPDGLITPVLKQADLLPLSVISSTMKDYAARAKQRRLKPSEYEGGVSAVSNLGMYGIKEFSAIINPPQSSILAVGAGEARPVVRKGQIVPATLIGATLSCDHRAIDGATGAELLSAFRHHIEVPLTLLGI